MGEAENAEIVETPAESEELTAEVGAEVEQDTESETPQEMEIVSAGEDTPTQHNRINAEERLRRKRERQLAAGENDNPELERLRAENAQLKQAQRPEMPKEEDYLDDPNPNAFREATQAWIRDETAAAAAATSSPAPNPERQIDAVLNDHYSRVNDLPIGSYDEKEAAVIEYFGENTTTGMIAVAGADSAKLIAYFGSNPAAMQRFRRRVESEGVNAQAEIGRICATLELKPKQSSAPQPESKVEGGNSGSAHGNESKWRKAYDEALNKGDIKQYRKLKAEGKQAGYDISV